MRISFPQLGSSVEALTRLHMLSFGAPAVPILGQPIRGRALRLTGLASDDPNSAAEEAAPTAARGAGTGE